METSLIGTFLVLLSLGGEWLGAEWRANTAEELSLFPNPERGFYYYQDLTQPNDSWATLREKTNMSLLAGKVFLKDYREKSELPGDFLEDLERGFSKARESGLKVVLRVHYGHVGPGGDYQTYQDPEMEIILGHIEQLAPVWEKNADVIALIEAGHVGPWGEWHTTKITKEPLLQRKVFKKILSNTPRNRMVLLRYPELKRSIFERRESLTEKDSYQPTDLARTGHHNDCFLSSETDVGTYGRGEGGREEEVSYLEKETLYTVYGGETCAVHEFNDAARTLVELDRLNASYLNSSYHQEVLDKWKAQGCYEEVSRLLGARFVVRKFEGQKVEIENVGFASLYNERPVYWVFEKEGKISKRILVEQDARVWKSGEKYTLKLPENLEGVSRVGLWLPDGAGSLQEDSRYAYRFANENCWDEEGGVNWILEKSDE